MLIEELRVRQGFGPEGFIEAEMAFVEDLRKGNKTTYANIACFDFDSYAVSDVSMMDGKDSEALIEYETREEALASKYGEIFKRLEEAVKLVQ